VAASGAKGRKMQEREVCWFDPNQTRFRLISQPFADSRKLLSTWYVQQPVQQPAHKPSVPISPSTAARAVSSDVCP
jgi:hypothetical protein